MKINKDLLKNASSFNPFEDLPPSAEHQCQLAADLSIAIYRYREKKHLTQAELGKMLGLTQPQISKLESGDANLTIERMSHILELLQYQVQLQPITKPHHYQEMASSNNTWFITEASAPCSTIFAFA